MKLCMFISLVFVALVELTSGTSILDLAQQLGASQLVQYVRQAGLEAALNGPGPFTVFAPTNAAFEALPANVKDQLSQNSGILQHVLSFHAAVGQTYSSQLQDEMAVSTLAGLQAKINIYTVQGNKVVTVDGAKVVSADHNATNGVIHVIDRVMYPLPVSDIPTTLTGYPELGNLLYAVAQAQLVSTLQGAGPFTVFAPTNAAFDKLPPQAFSDLLSNETALIDVLKYHVVQATLYSTGLDTATAQTLQGASVKVVVKSDGVSINNGQVVKADISAKNGVIHEIDTVLLPPK